jgi:adenylate cyclase
MQWLVVPAIVLIAFAVCRHLLHRVRQLDRRLADSKEQLERLQRLFERFVPSDVVERLTDSGDEVRPQRRRVTMLFADLRDFTAMCAGLDPTQSVTIVNGYFERMSDAITNHHGHLTELVGDGLLALFGAVEPNPWQARDAVMAALAMREALERYNAQLRAESLPELRFGIGIHSGEVVCGVMGAGALRKFGVTGDPINVASRVEGLTREHRVDLLVTDEVRSALDEEFRLRSMPLSYVKGKVEPVQTYYIEGIERQVERREAPSNAVPPSAQTSSQRGD